MADKQTTSEKRKQEKFNRIQGDLSAAFKQATKDVKNLSKNTNTASASVLLSNENLAKALNKTIRDITKTVNDSRSVTRASTKTLAKVMDRMGSEMGGLTGRLAADLGKISLYTKRVDVLAGSLKSVNEFMASVSYRTGTVSTPDEIRTDIERMMEMARPLPEDLFQKFEKIANSTEAAVTSRSKSSADAYTTMINGLRRIMADNSVVNEMEDLENRIEDLKDSVNTNTEATKESDESGGILGMGAQMMGLPKSMGRILGKFAGPAALIGVGTHVMKSTLLLQHELVKLQTSTNAAHLRAFTSLLVPLEEGIGLQNRVAALGAGTLQTKQFGKITTDLGRLSEIFNMSATDLFDATTEASEGQYLNNIKLVESVDDTVEAMLALAKSSGLGAQAILAIKKESGEFANNLRDITTAQQRGKIADFMMKNISAFSSMHIEHETIRRYTGIVSDLMASKPSEMIEKLGRIRPEAVQPVMRAATVPGSTSVDMMAVLLRELQKGPGRVYDKHGESYLVRRQIDTSTRVEGEINTLRDLTLSISSSTKNFDTVMKTLEDSVRTGFHGGLESSVQFTIDKMMTQMKNTGANLGLDVASDKMMSAAHLMWDAADNMNSPTWLEDTVTVDKWLINRVGDKVKDTGKSWFGSLKDSWSEWISDYQVKGNKKLEDSQHELNDTTQELIDTYKKGLEEKSKPKIGSSLIGPPPTSKKTTSTNSKVVPSNVPTMTTQPERLVVVQSNGPGMLARPDPKLSDAAVGTEANTAEIVRLLKHPITPSTPFTPNGRSTGGQ